jgi:seipin
LSTLLFLLTSFTLLAISTTAFLFFYYAYVPQVDLSRVLYLQYGTPGYTYPFAHTQLETSALTSNQPYDISIDIYLPRTPSNVDAGNFMLDLSLLSPPSTPPSVPSSITTVIPNTTTTIAHSRRPAILPYSSPVLTIYQTIIDLPLHFLGFRNPDATTLHIPMFERVSFARGYRNIPTALTLSLQTQAHSAIPLQIYSAKILFQARFQGLRWFVYNYRMLSWILFSTIFYTLTISSMAITWGLVSYFIFPAKPTDQITIKLDSEAEQSNGHVKAEGSKKVKAEEDDSSLDAAIADFSDTPTQFPTLSRQMPLRFPVQQQRSGSGRSPVKREPEATMQETTVEPLAAATAEDAADDEDEDGVPPSRRDDRRAIDSGIGTSMESEIVASGVTRRRSSRSLRGKD